LSILAKNGAFFGIPALVFSPGQLCPGLLLLPQCMPAASAKYVEISERRQQHGEKIPMQSSCGGLRGAASWHQLVWRNRLSLTGTDRPPASVNLFQHANERLSPAFLVLRVTRQRLGLLLHRRRRKIQQGLGALYKQFDFLIRWSASVRVLTAGRYRFVFYVAWLSFKVDCSSVFFMWFRKVPNGRREPA
jgi:hypothetical protein